MSGRRIGRIIAGILAGGMCMGVSCANLKQQACDCPEPTGWQIAAGDLEEFYNWLQDGDED